MDNTSTVTNDVATYYGYLVFKEDGKIISPKGNELIGYFFTYPYSHVTIKYDGKSHKLLRAKLVFELFSGQKVPKGYILRFKDNDTRHCGFDNLYLESRKDFAARQPHSRKRKLSEKAQNEIRNLYYDKNRKKRAGAPSLRELSDKYKCSLSTIQKILKD